MLFRDLFFYRCRLLFQGGGSIPVFRKKSFYEIRGNDDTLVLEHLAQFSGIVAFLLRFLKSFSSSSAASGRVFLSSFSGKS